MIKATVRNLRRVQTAVWIGSKRYVFPSGITVRMNLTEEMVKELKRNRHFDVQIIGGIVSETKDTQNKEAKDKRGLETASRNEVERGNGQDSSQVNTETEETNHTSQDPDNLTTTANKETEKAEAEVVESAEASEEKKPEFFKMSKEDLAIYLAERGVPTQGMSRKDMLKRTKEV